MCNIVPPLRHCVAAAGRDAFRSVLAGLTFAWEAVPFKKDELLSKLEGCPARLGRCPARVASYPARLGRYPARLGRRLARLGDVLFGLGGFPEGVDYLKNPIKRGIFAKTAERALSAHLSRFNSKSEVENGRRRGR